MRPVNLLPAEKQVAAAAPGKPNLGLIGGVAAGLVAVVVVAGYFAMAKVDNVKSETAAATQAATDATSQVASIQSQIESLGKPVVDSDRQLAQGAEQVLVGAYTERHDFVRLARELRGIMDPSGWYVSIEASTSAGEDGQSVTITGYLPSKELVASFNERVNSTRTMDGAETTSIESEVLSNLDTKKPGTYWKFTTVAKLVDTVAPSADGATSGGISSDDGTTVANGGGGDGELSLSLLPEPKRAAAPKQPAKPKNPFDLAASNAAKGSGS